MSIRLKQLSWTLVAALLVAWISYQQSYRSHTAAVSPNAQSSSSVGGRASRDIAARTDKLDQLRGLLSRPFNSQNSNGAWEVISGLSVDQIKQALDAIPKDKVSESARSMAKSLYFRWAQIDPMEAVTAAALEEKKEGADRSGNLRNILASAYSGWFKQDPEAAFKWAASVGLEHRQFCTRMMGRYLASLPLSVAVEKMEACGPEVAKETFRHQGQEMISSPEHRKAFLDRVANSGITSYYSQQILNQFTQNWGSADPAAALSGLDGIPLDGEQKDQVRKEIIRSWAAKNPAEAVAWLAKERTPQAMAQQIEIYTLWMANDRDAAQVAFDSLSRNSPGLREEFMKTQLKFYYQEGWIPFGRVGTAENFSFLHLKASYDHWANGAPSDAEKWLGTLEPSLKQKFHTPTDDEH